MNLPSRQECLELFEKYHVPGNIKLHCETVNKVAIFLATKLKEKEVDVDIDLVDRLSLVHDLMKAVTFELREEPEFQCYPTEEEIVFWRDFREKHKAKHDIEVTASVFEEQYPEFAEIIRLSGAWHILTNEKPFELQIAHYSDWRVFVDKIIPLQERIDGIYERYKEKIDADGIDFWNKRMQTDKKVEQTIFEKLDFMPKQLKEMIENE